MRGMIGPDEFIPLAEHTGLIKPLTELVLRQAVRQCRPWRGRRTRACPSRSTSPSPTCSTSNSCRPCGRILDEKGSPQTQLQLEITESTIMVDPERAQRVLVELAEMGIALSVDDFGTGYSSLAYLRRLPVQELKIDRPSSSTSRPTTKTPQSFAPRSDSGTASDSPSSPRESRTHDRSGADGARLRHPAGLPPLRPTTS